MSDHAAKTPAELRLEALGISPKVIFGFLAGLFLTAVGAALAAITPDTLKDLGPWALPVYAGITATAGFVAGYAKRDPVREVGQEVVKEAAATSPPPTETKPVATEYPAANIPPGIG